MAQQQRKNPEHILQVNWSMQHRALYLINLTIEALEKAALLNNINVIINNEEISLLKLTIQRSNKRLTTLIYLTLRLNNIAQLEQLINKFENLANIYHVNRA